MRISEAPLDFKLNTIPAAQLVVEYCFCFVIIDSKSDTVQLAHFSIDEYLQEKQFPFITSGHRTVALARINYMPLPWLSEALQVLGEDGDEEVSEQDSEPLKILSNRHNAKAPSSQATAGPSLQAAGSPTSATSTPGTLLKSLSGTGPDGPTNLQYGLPVNNYSAPWFPGKPEQSWQVTKLEDLRWIPEKRSVESVSHPAADPSNTRENLSEAGLLEPTTLKKLIFMDYAALN